MTKQSCKIIPLFSSILLIIEFALISQYAVAAGEILPSPKIHELGIPVRSVNWVNVHPGRNKEGTPCLYATMGQNADNFFVLQIDPENGDFHQFIAPAENSNFPTATLMSRTGILYVGAAWSGHLFSFDPDQDTLKDLGAINPGKATFPCRIAEDENGKIWIGSYGTADLTCYDPALGKFTRYGRMDDVDMYCYPLVSKDGKIACLIKVAYPHVVVFDPMTQQKTKVGPVTTKGQETLDMRHGNDGWLYIITSSKGNFRIEGTKAIPVEKTPPPPPQPTLPDGSKFTFTDSSEQIYRTLKISKPDGKVLTYKLNYQAGGNSIFYLHAGPDGCVYGSSYLPLHLFRYDPKSKNLVDLGRCSASAGEAYSMANYQGKIYISAYPAANISVYNPTQPYHFGDQPDDNPRDLGRIDDISYRPRSTLAGPMGRVWVASIPDYGRWGGPLSHYDPQTGQKKAYYRIFGDGSCYTLAHLAKQKLLAVGTNIAGGSGTQPKVEQASLFLWDYQNEKKVWEGKPDRDTKVFNALLAHTDGRLYGTIKGKDTTPEIFIFDPQSRTFTDRVALPPGAPLDLGLQEGPDGKIYGFTESCLYQFDPITLALKEIISSEKEFSVPGPIIGNNIYFANEYCLRTAEIFLSSSSEISTISP